MVAVEYFMFWFNAAGKSLVVDIIISVAVAVDMMSFWVNQETVFPMRTELVAEIQI